MTPSACHLAEDAYVCLADKRLVFSSLRDDRYRCLDLAKTEVAIRMFPGLEGQTPARLTDVPATDHEQTQDVVCALADKGLLADGEAVGKPMAPVRIPVAANSLLSNKLASRPRHNIGHWASFLQASLKASGKLRFQSLRRTVRGVESRRRRYRNPGSQDNDALRERTLRELVAIFHRLRPYYARDYLCRFDSLALLEFLAHYRQFPQWVFGVSGEPFGAHCWVQEGNCVLNDSIDRIGQYTPIMAF